MTTTTAAATTTQAARGRTVLLTATTGLVLSVVSVVGVGSASAAPATTPAGATASFSGDAYGSAVNVASLVRSGRSAPVVLGCTTKAGLSRSNTTAGLSLAPLASTGTVATTATTSATPSRAATTATTERVRLLAGLVSATAVTSASATTARAGGFAVDAAGTTLTGLTVAGRAIRADAAPNTRIDLPGVGYLVVNEQTRSITAKNAYLDVNALHLVVTAKNLLGAAVGSNVVISHARSGLSAPVAGVLGGQAYGTRLAVGQLVKSGPTFTATLPCLGTDGRVRTNTGAGVDLPGVLKSGTVRNTARGTVNGTTVTGETTSTVDGTNLLNGLVTASVIKADATVTKTGATRTLSAAGSTFGTLSVAGHPEIKADVALNTRVELAGVGTLYLRRVVQTGTSIEVRMIELVTTRPVAGLAVGADLRVAVARVAAS